MSLSKMLLLLFLPLLLACSVAAERRERDAQALSEFQGFAGEPVERVHSFTGVDRWRSFDDYTLAIWTGVNRSYLLKTKGRCYGLHDQITIRVTSTQGFIDRGLDKIVFGQTWCIIDEIRPLDERARKQAKRAK